MKRLTRQLWMLVMLAISVGGHADRWDEAYYEREKKAINDTMAATKWAIEEGIATYYREGGEDGFKDMVKKTRKGYEKFMFGPGGVQVDSEHHFAMFFIKAFNSTYNIIALHRETLPGGIYEFWLVKVSADHRSSDTARSMFYVTRADEVRGRREILHKSAVHRHSSVTRLRRGRCLCFRWTIWRCCGIWLPGAIRRVTRIPT